MNSALHADAVIWQIIQSAAAMSLYRPLKTKKNQDFQNLEIDLCLLYQIMKSYVVDGIAARNLSKNSG